MESDRFSIHKRLAVQRSCKAILYCGWILVGILGINLLAPTSRVMALECPSHVLIYDGWEDEKLFEEADMFADTEHIKWGTEVCYIETRKRWLTTWYYVQAADSMFGWIDSKKLLNESDFQERVSERHQAYTLQLGRVLTGLQTLEHWLSENDVQTFRIGGYRNVVQDWLADTATEPYLASVLTNQIVLSGTGLQTKSIELNEGLWTVAVELNESEDCSGKNTCRETNFIARLESVDGGDETLFNEIVGAFEASTTVRVKTEGGYGVVQGKSILTVDARGEWTFTFEEQ